MNQPNVTIANLRAQLAAAHRDVELLISQCLAEWEDAEKRVTAVLSHTPMSAAVVHELRELAKQFESMPPVTPPSAFWDGVECGRRGCIETIRERAHEIENSSRYSLDEALATARREGAVTAIHALADRAAERFAGVGNGGRALGVVNVKWSVNSGDHPHTAFWVHSDEQLVKDIRAYADEIAKGGVL